MRWLVKRSDARHKNTPNMVSLFRWIVRYRRDAPLFRLFTWPKEFHCSGIDGRDAFLLKNVLIHMQFSLSSMPPLIILFDQACSRGT